MFGALFFSSLFSSNAHALSCMEGVTDTNIGAYASDIPINAVISVWLLWVDLDVYPLTLRLSDTQEEVPATYTDVGINGLVRIEPEEDLMPNTKYEVFESSFMHQTVLQFTTGEERDDTPPNAPEILDVSKDYGFDMWGSWKWLDLSLNEKEANGYYKIEVSRTSDFSNSEITYVKDPYIGSGLCSSNIDMDPSAVQWIKVTAIDVAGNESTTNEPYQRGCSSTQPPMHLLLPMLSISLLVSRRRRLA